MDQDAVYKDAEKLYKALCLIPADKHKELCELLGYNYSSELFDDLMLSLMALSIMLKTYRNLKEVSI